MKSDAGVVFGVFGTIVTTIVILAAVLSVSDTHLRRVREEMLEDWKWRGGLDPLVTEAPSGVERGKELFTLVCIACHGPSAEGNRAVDSPALHQQEVWYLAAQIGKFREGLRGLHPDDITGGQMKAMVASLPDRAAYEDLAEYIVTLDAPLPEPTVNGDIHAGKDRYEIACAPCHGKGGQGQREYSAPALVGQNDWYLAAQLEKFRKGVRGRHPRDHTGALMQAMVGMLPSSQAARDIIAYISTLPRNGAAPGAFAAVARPEILQGPAQADGTDNLGVTEGSVSPAAEAKLMFETRCASCHGVSGKGDGAAAAGLPDKPRNYRDADWQAQITDDELAKVILEGGAAVGKSVFMVPNPDLEDKPEVLTEIIKIIRSFGE